MSKNDADNFFATLPAKVEKAIAAVIRLLSSYLLMIFFFTFRPFHAAWIFTCPNRSDRFFITPLLALSLSLFLATMLAPTPEHDSAIDFFKLFASRLSPDSSLAKSLANIFPLLLAAIALIHAVKWMLLETGVAKQDVAVLTSLFHYTLAAQFGAMFIVVMAFQVPVALSIHGRISPTAAQWNLLLHTLPWIGLYVALVPSLVPAIALWQFQTTIRRTPANPRLVATPLIPIIAFGIFAFTLSFNSTLPLLYTKPPQSPATQPASSSASTTTTAP